MPTMGYDKVMCKNIRRFEKKILKRNLGPKKNDNDVDWVIRTNEEVKSTIWENRNNMISTKH